MKKEEGPFFRQMNETPDARGELRFQFVEKDERRRESPEVFRERVWFLVDACMSGNEDVALVRGIDTNSAESIEMIKAVISKWADCNPEWEAKEESIFKKITRGGPERVLSKHGLFPGVYGLNANKVIPTR